ncbi:MAG: PAS domain S-box protein, partial [Bacteroidetes bacterium]|nr:PAS domain S-box protein [Bacteroidota bacterium]
LSESVLRSAFENSSIGMALVSPKGQWLRVNRALSRMLGYSEREMLALRFQDMTYPEDLEKDIAFMNKFFTGEENTRNTVKRYIRKNHSPLWTNVNISTVRNDAGLLEYFIVQIEDFTEKRHAQQEIIRLNRLYRFISEMNTSLLKSKSREEVFAEACRIAIDFGKFRMTWIGYNDASGNIIPVAWAGHIDGYLEKIKISIYEEPFSNGPTGQAIRNKTYYYCNDIANDINMAPWREEALKRNYHSSISLPIVVKGHLEAVYTLYMSEPDFFNETEINLLLGVTENIAYALDKINLSELNKKAEAELKESEQKFRSLVEQSLAGVAILSNEKFLYVNPEFEKTVGYTKEQLLSKITIDKLVHEDDIERVKSNYAQRIKGGSPEPHYISKVIKSDGSILYIEIVASRISYNNQPAIIVTTIDITNRIEEEKKISAAVTEAQEKERMEIGMELHDNVKQILAASLLNIDFLISNPFNPDISISTLKKLKEYIKEAINETRRLSHQLSPSTDLDISLTEKIKTLIDDMQLSIDLDVALNIEEFEIPIPNMIQLSIYRIMQEQFANILKHARASKVWIAIKKEQPDILVLIKDNGKGFDNHLKKGGIGLENIQRRVLALNGKIEINTAPGKGCELIIHIPGSEINQH